MRQEAMLSALRQAATSGEQFHGLVDEARLVKQKHAVFCRVHVFVVSTLQRHGDIPKRDLCRYVNWIPLATLRYLQYSPILLRLLIAVGR